MDSSSNMERSTRIFCQAVLSICMACAGDVRRAKAEPECIARPTVFLGAIKGANDLADPANIAGFRHATNTGFYLTSYALSVIPNLSGNVPRILGNFESAYGIIEVGTNPNQMPDVAREFGRYLDDEHHWTWGTEKGSTWPADIAKAGWAPDIALLNPFNMGAEGPSDPYYKMNVLALDDVKKASPSIRHVLPFVSPNVRVLKPENHEVDWNDTGWQEWRDLAMKAGGLAEDTPGNYFTKGREEAYRALVAQEIKWATAHGLVSVVLISPYKLGGGGSNGPDDAYLQAAQAEVAYLHKSGADPTIYVAANYAEAAAAVTPATETTPNSVAQVALWLAKNAAKSPFPPSWRDERAASCARAE